MPTSFFLGGIARRMDVHLLSGAEGNFGPWGILDWICGTTVGDGEDEAASTVDDAQSQLSASLSQDGDLDEKIRRAVEESTRRFRDGSRRRLRRKRRDE